MPPIRTFDSVTENQNRRGGACRLRLPLTAEASLAHNPMPSSAITEDNVVIHSASSVFESLPAEPGQEIQVLPQDPHLLQELQASRRTA